MCFTGIESHTSVDNICAAATPEIDMSVSNESAGAIARSGNVMKRGHKVVDSEATQARYHENPVCDPSDNTAEIATLGNVNNVKTDLNTSLDNQQPEAPGELFSSNLNLSKSFAQKKVSHRGKEYMFKYREPGLFDDDGNDLLERLLKLEQLNKEDFTKVNSSNEASSDNCEEKVQGHSQGSSGGGDGQEVKVNVNKADPDVKSTISCNGDGHTSGYSSGEGITTRSAHGNISQTPAQHVNQQYFTHPQSFTNPQNSSASYYYLNNQLEQSEYDVVIEEEEDSSDSDQKSPSCQAVPDAPVPPLPVNDENWT